MVLLLGLLINNQVDVSNTRELTLLSWTMRSRSRSQRWFSFSSSGIDDQLVRSSRVIRPAARLATIGVLITAALITAVGIGFDLARGGAALTQIVPRNLFIGAGGQYRCVCGAGTPETPAGATATAADGSGRMRIGLQ